MMRSAVLLFFTAAALTIPTAASAAKPPAARCAGATATIVGTSGPDVICGGVGGCCPVAPNTGDDELYAGSGGLACRTAGTR